MPYFSIVIPTFNREHLVRRAIGSCLRQDFEDFEVLVVDDASNDGTVAAVQKVRDARVRLVRHDANKGVGPARNSGFAVARGAWVVCLDSDDELYPGALSIIRSRAHGTGEEVGGLRFMCRLDDGRLSPNPPFRDEIWDYQQYLRWFESTTASGLQESLPVVRRETFAKVRYPADRSGEDLYHLDFAKLFRIGAFSDIARLYHSDAHNNLSLVTSMRALHIERAIMASPAWARMLEGVLEKHGSELARFAPTVLGRMESAAAAQHFLAGDRSKGIRYSRRFLRRHPFSIRVWLVLVFGLLGPRQLSWLRALRYRIKLAFETSGRRP